EPHAASPEHGNNSTAAGIYFTDPHQSQPSFGRLRNIPTLRGTEVGRLYGRPLYDAMLWGNLLQQPWAVYRDTFLEVGGFAEDVRYCEDWDLYLRITRRFPVALSDRVISYHHVKGENLHLRQGQEEMHTRVLQRRLQEADLLALRERWTLRRRLANYYKTAGDRSRPGDLGRAWRHYLRSLATWPF